MFFHHQLSHQYADQTGVFEKWQLMFEQLFGLTAEEMPLMPL